MQSEMEVCFEENTMPVVVPVKIFILKGIESIIETARNVSKHVSDIFVHAKI